MNQSINATLCVEVVICCAAFKIVLTDEPAVSAPSVGAYAKPVKCSTFVFIKSAITLHYTTVEVCVFSKYRCCNFFAVSPVVEQMHRSHQSQGPHRSCGDEQDRAMTQVTNSDKHTLLVYFVFLLMEQHFFLQFLFLNHNCCGVLNEIP